MKVKGYGDQETLMLEIDAYQHIFSFVTLLGNLESPKQPGGSSL